MRRRLLVNGIDTIYNNTTRRNNLVAWANAKGFDTFEYPYGLGQNGDSLDAILAPSGPGSFNNTNSTNFASFITYCRNHNIPNHVAIRDITTTELNNPPYGDKLINQYQKELIKLKDIKSSLDVASQEPSVSVDDPQNPPDNLRLVAEYRYRQGVLALTMAE